jgi:hypothetical protein
MKNTMNQESIYRENKELKIDARIAKINLIFYKKVLERERIGKDENSVEALYIDCIMPEIDQILNTNKEFKFNISSIPEKLHVSILAFDEGGKYEDIKKEVKKLVKLTS